MADIGSMSLRSNIQSRLRSAARSAYRPSFLAGAALLIGAIVVAPHIYRLSKQLSRQPIYLVEGGEVRISKPHRWVSRDFFKAAIDRGGLDTPLSVADSTLVSKLQAGLEGDPWIESVDKIQVSLKSGVEVFVTYRTPTLMVQTLDGLYPVDANGVVLPSQDFAVGDKSGFPLLRLFDGKAPAGIGVRWRDARVVSAARIAGELSPVDDVNNLWTRCQLVDIRPSEVDEKSFEMYSKGGSRIVWGRVGDASRDVEPTDEQKAGKLEQILSARGSLSAPAGPYLIDLRLWDQITLEPLAVSYR